MSDVSIKGSGNGYSIIISDTADLDKSLIELNKVIQDLPESSNDNKIEFTIVTGNRLLDKAQTERIKNIVTKRDGYTIKKIDANVVDVAKVINLLNDNKTEVITDVVRSGQNKEYKNDIIFVGHVHKGGQITTTGDVFVLGEVEGIIHAGFEDNTDAVIIGDVSEAQQVRIADVISIVADSKEEYEKAKCIYLDDLHNIAFGNSQTIKDLMNKRKK